MAAMPTPFPCNGILVIRAIYPGVSSLNKYNHTTNIYTFRILPFLAKNHCLFLQKYERRRSQRKVSWNYPGKRYVDKSMKKGQLPLKSSNRSAVRIWKETGSDPALQSCFLRSVIKIQSEQGLSTKSRALKKKTPKALKFYQLRNKIRRLDKANKIYNMGCNLL